ncbi:reverse transcriptase domain-containing protein, partial [bacterium]|nr:reverse transcriptase domain-containing protein [bacterium]
MVFSKSDVGHPWQNGVAERTNQALKIIAKKLLIASGVPSEFWVYAMKYAATVRNITGVKVHNKLQSPYYEVFGHGVDIQVLHPFGCKAYMARNVIAQNLSKQHPASRPDWCVSRFPVWFIGYSSVTLHPKKYVVVLSNSILKRQGSAPGYVQETSELIFDHENYVNRPALNNAGSVNAQNGEHPGLTGDRTELTDNSILPPELVILPPELVTLPPELVILPPELSIRRDLDDWLNDLLDSQKEDQEYKSESDCEDDNPDEDCPQSGGEAALNNAGSALNNASELVPALNNADVIPALNNADVVPALNNANAGLVEDFLEFARDRTRMDQSSLQDKYPGWGPSGFSPEILEEVEGGVDAENNADVGTDQPTDDIEHLVNHFKANGRVSEDELKKQVIYLSCKYSHIQLQGGNYGDEADERTHKVYATVKLNPALNNADSTNRAAHSVLATAVAKGEEYGKIIDESSVDVSESRAKELNGLLETTLTEVSIDEAGDANICGSKWVDKVKPDGSLKSRLVVQGFTQVWLKDYHDTFSAVASMTTFRILINIAAILGWDIFTIDVSQAYTQGELLDDIFIKAPRSHPLPKGVVYKLKRPLYGTKQAGRCWYLHVTKTLRSIGLTQLAKDSCLFVKMNHGKPSLIISVLVDDLLILAEYNETVEWFHTEFSDTYKVSQFEQCKVYNGINVHRLEKHCY